MTWLEVAGKATMVLAGGFLAAGMLRGASAAVRHFLWTAVLAAVLALPATMVVTPRWGIRPAMETAPVEDPGTVMVVRGRQAAGWTPGWLVLWGIGSAVAGARFLWGTARVRKLRRQSAAAPYAQGPAAEMARALGLGGRVEVLECAGVPVPLACGIWHPAVLLPRGAGEWPEARLGSVLLHELMHVRRRDLGAQALAQVVCCLYWFHPLAWMAAGQLRRERERACDDAVLLGGVPAHQYASDLMAVARGLAARHRWAGAAFGLGAGSELESRIRALFDGRKREPLRRMAALWVGLAVAAVLLPVAAVTVHAQASRGGLVGVVVDPSGARVVGVRVTARNQDGSNQEVTRAGMVGEYRFTAIPPGRYTVEFAAPGFAMLTVNAVVTANETARVDATLNLGSVSENVTVKGQKPPGAPAGPAMAPHTPQRIKVGGNVQPVKLIRPTRPEFPPELQALGVQGTVVIHAVISKNGEVLSPVVLNTDVDQRLAKAALDAVSQWLYSPSLLNGEAVETATTITVDFTLNP